MLLWGALFAAAVGLGWVLGRLWRIAAVGSAYRSKVLCSIVFETGRSVDPQRVDDVSADAYRLMRLFRSRVDPVARTVTTSLFGLRARTATYRAGLGATLFLSGSPADFEAAPLTSQRGTDTHGSGGESLRVHVAPAVQRVVDKAFTEPNPRRLRRTRAVVVLRDGEIIAEQYARGFDASTRLPGWSMAKSVLNALVGILIGQEQISLQDKALLPAWQPPDPRAAITVEDLLRMRTGLKFSEDYADYSSDVVEMLFNQPDSARYAARQPLIASPGTAWSYASGTSNILSAIVRRTVGEREYFDWPRRALFESLGMSSAVLEPDAAGTFVCSSFMLATARDWARFGQLFAQDGVWNGGRLLPEGWVSFSTTPTPQSGGEFGAHWWLKLKPEIGGSTSGAVRIPSDAFFAVGHEAQTLTVIPSRRLVVARLGLSVYVDAWNQAEFIAELLDAL
jgi:CubicO group peptidase (beta-lactamase class C family)